MKKRKDRDLWLLLGFCSIVFSAGIISGCAKKDDPSVISTTTGGGVSTKSVVTVKGAGS